MSPSPAVTGALDVGSELRRPAAPSPSLTPAPTPTSLNSAFAPHEFDLVVTTITTTLPGATAFVNNSTQIPVGPVVGGILGGVVLAVLGVTIWKCWGRSIEKQDVKSQRRRAALAYRRAVTHGKRAISGATRRGASTLSDSPPSTGRKVSFATGDNSSEKSGNSVTTPSAISSTSSASSSKSNSPPSTMKARAPEGTNGDSSVAFLRRPGLPSKRTDSTTPLRPSPLSQAVISAPTSPSPSDSSTTRSTPSSPPPPPPRSPNRPSKAKTTNLSSLVPSGLVLSRPLKATVPGPPPRSLMSTQLDKISEGPATPNRLSAASNSEVSYYSADSAEAHADRARPKRSLTSLLSEVQRLSGITRSSSGNRNSGYSTSDDLDDDNTARSRAWPWNSVRPLFSGNGSQAHNPSRLSTGSDSLISSPDGDPDDIGRAYGGDDIEEGSSAEKDALSEDDHHHPSIPGSFA